MKSLRFAVKTKAISHVRAELDSLLKSPQAKTILRFELLLLGVIWLGYGTFYRFLPPQIPLWFSKPWGTDQLIVSQHLILLPSLVTVLFAINVRLASIALTKYQLLAMILLWAQLLASLLAAITLMHIIFMLA